MTTPSLVTGVFDDEVTKERAPVKRANPFDEFLASIPMMKTSELIIWMTRLEMLVSMFVDENTPEETVNTIGNTAGRALAAEVDRRFPRP
jgi:hypothetical protein